MKTKSNSRAVDRFMELPPNRIDFEIGRYYLRNGVLDVAISIFTKLIDSNTQVNPVCFLYRAAAYWRRGMYSGACDDLTKAIDMNPELGLAKYYRGWCYEWLRQNEAAIDDYSAVIELLTNVKTQWDRVFHNPSPSYYSNGDYQIAAQDFAEIIQFRLNPAHPYRNRARAYANIGATNLAIAGFNKALEINPKDINSYAWLAELESLPEEWELPES